MNDLQIRTLIAKENKRDFMANIELARRMATYSVEAASSCLYAWNIKNSKEKSVSELSRNSIKEKESYYKSIVIGPGIRLAEIVFSCWGNVDVFAESLEPQNGFAIGRAVAIDLESNSRIETKSKKKIQTSDVGTASNAARAIALRNAIFAIIPKIFIESIFEECKLIASGMKKPEKDLSSNETVEDYFRKMKEATFKLIESKYGENSVKSVLDYFKVDSIESISNEQILHLKSIGNAINNNEFTFNQVFCSDLEEEKIDVSERIKMITGGKK